ncbi:MAG TPA: glycosyltransferase family 2 protein [Flavobacteriales bacterium]|nr:glycosyltransferase family 2 protein [Flavobacteriales bacterium]
MSQTVDISLVIPLYNEEESLPELCAWIKRVCDANNYSYEILLIDDGSTDKSWEIVEGLSKENSNVKGIKFRRNYGKSAALNVGFEACTGNVVITMDADLQDSPEEIPGLYNMVMVDGFDLVSGWKEKRYDPITKTLPTKLFNWATRRMSGIKLHDFNCGLKAYKSKVVKNIEVIGEMHRYIPVIAKWAGFKKIGEKSVAHQARKYGKSKFGLERFINGFLDLFTITFISRFGKKPMHFFGAIGTIMFFIGFVLVMWMGIDKLFFNTAGKLLAQRTEFFLAMFVMIIGTLFFIGGFLAELIIRNSPDRGKYAVEQWLGVKNQ